MALRVLFLGKLADLAGQGERVIDSAGPLDWQGLLGALDPLLAGELDGPKVRVAVNGTILADKTALSVGEGDEIAFLPPVSGG